MVVFFGSSRLTITSRRRYGPSRKGAIVIQIRRGIQAGKLKEFSSSPLVQWQIAPVVLAFINLIGSVELVFLHLLQPMREPTGRPGHGEDRRKGVGGNAHRVVDNSRVKVDIRIDALPAQ